MNQRDSVKKKLRDAQEMRKDSKLSSKNIRDTEVGEDFDMFADETGSKAKRLQAMINKRNEENR